MKALSLWQPWASLIAADVKRFETRHWDTRYRGPIEIHAAKRLEAVGISDELRAICERRFGADWSDTLPRGAVVAIAELVGVWPTPRAMRCNLIDDAEFACGNYKPGRFAWELNHVRAFDPPVPYRGRQGLFNIPDGLVYNGRETRGGPG